MIILRNKSFSNIDPIPYKSGWQRFKSAASGTYYGAFVGAIGGGMAGIFGGIRGIRTGAIIGAALGALIGGNYGWSSTSKKSIDSENKFREKQKYDVENPDKYFQKLFKDDQSIIYKLKAIESKFDIKFSEDLYKFLKIRKQFIPDIVDWFKTYNKPEYGSKLLNVPETVMYDIFPNSIEYELDDNIKYGDGDKFCCAVLIDPSQADDHFIVYHPKTGKYGFDITEEDGKYSSLKDAIVDLCKDNIDFLNTSGKQFDKDGSLVDLYNRWLKFIKSKL